MTDANLKLLEFQKCINSCKNLSVSKFIESCDSKQLQDFAIETAMNNKDIWCNLSLDNFYFLYSKIEKDEPDIFGFLAVIELQPEQYKVIKEKIDFFNLFTLITSPFILKDTLYTILNFVEITDIYKADEKNQLKILISDVLKK